MDTGYHTKYFRRYDEVEYVFGRTLTATQRELVQTYITFGIRPGDGCWTCDNGMVRILTGEIDRFEYAVAHGEQDWPWPAFSPETPWELR